MTSNSITSYSLFDGAAEASVARGGHFFFVVHFQKCGEDALPDFVAALDFIGLGAQIPEHKPDVAFVARVVVVVRVDNADSVGKHDAAFAHSAG